MRAVRRALQTPATRSIYKSQLRAISKSAQQNATMTQRLLPSSPRPTPAPAFNQEPSGAANESGERPSTKRNLRREQLIMDDSFIGLTGGEIFHEMMLRHNVDSHYPIS